MIAGRYSLDREVGRGGAGVVWLGRDQMLGREVAIKRIGLLPGAGDTDLARAEREARLSARLNHPHVVAVFDVVVDDDSGAHWLVMEYVEGQNLLQLVKQRGRLAPDEAAPLLRQAADALVAAHRAGIAHRDVKPSNIMVDADGQVKLTDFGIARIETDATLTQTGMVTGSPAYLAPEIAAGGRGGEAADVWSLGATAFHMLAGRAPYEIGDNVMGALYRIVNEEPPRLPDAGWMAPLLENTMVRDPARRWSMEQVRNFLARRPQADSDATQMLPPAVPPPTSPPVAPPAGAAARRSSPRLLLLALGAVLALVLGLVLYTALTGTETGSDRSAAPTSSPSSSKTPEKPTVEGMEAFIRDYVTTVSEDPSQSWQMLTPKFQQESGGFETYRNYWEDATNGRVLSISADPEDLTVSYQVHFDNFKNGPGPTILDLKFHDGRYLIDGERTEGFVPAD